MEVRQRVDCLGADYCKRGSAATSTQATKQASVKTAAMLLNFRQIFNNCSVFLRLAENITGCGIAFCSLYLYQYPSVQKFHDV
jgi:hypothetical protein